MKYKRGLFCSILTSAALLGAVSAPSVHASLDSTTGGSVSGSSGAAISGSRELPTSLQVAAARSAYAISQGISVSELDKADEAGLRVSEMQEALRSVAPDTFGGLWITTSPFFEVHVAYKDGLQAISAAVESFSLPVVFEKRSVSEKEMKSRLAKQRPGGAEVVWSLPTNSIEIRGAASSETIRALNVDFGADAVVNFRPEKAVMRPVHQGGLGLKQATNQTNNSCTTGFAIIEYGVRALTTAAHCTNANIVIDQETDGSFQNLSSPNTVSCTSTTDMETIWPANGNYVSSTVQGTAISGTMSPVIGATAWRYGATTGWRFGTWLYVSSSEYIQGNCPLVTHQLYVLDAGSDPGDSGGPIISQGSGGSVWRGIATTATGNSTQTGAEELSTQLSALGISLAP